MSVVHDGTLIYACDDWAIVRVWSAATGVCKRVFAEAEPSTKNVDFETPKIMLSTVHAHIIVVTYGKNIRVWNMRTSTLAYDSS